MRNPSSEVPALVLNEPEGRGRVAYMAGDLDRCFGRSRLPDHAALLANLVRWTTGSQIPLNVDGPGFLHCQLYRQDERLVLHLVNLTGHEAGHAPADGYFPVGPLKVTVEVPESANGPVQVSLLVAGKPIDACVDHGKVTFTVDRIDDHEVITLERT
jgi:hypothetical protein